MFCSIIGYPLKNPRSVKIWSDFFKRKKMKIKMNAIEINPKKFNFEIEKILSNKNFLASAITMPYKKKIISKVIIKDKLSKTSKSLNFILKKKNKIYGYNTDIFGAIETTKKLKKKKHNDLWFWWHRRSYIAIIFNQI